MRNAGIFALLTKGIAALLLALPGTRAAAISNDGDLNNLLNQQYKKQVLALRSPIQNKHLEFDSDGKSLKAVPEGGWTIHGAIRVEKLSLKPDKLSLEGPWVGFGADKQNQIPANPIPLGKPIKVEIRLDHALASVQEAESILNRVFFPGPEARGHWLPEYRRSGPLDEPPIKTIGDGGNNTDKDKTNPPVPIYTPDPSFSDEARKARYQGSVLLDVTIDKTGLVSRIRVVRALGLGLDLKAMETVRTWRFRPATRNGQPIAAMAMTEVNFRLY